MGRIIAKKALSQTNDVNHNRGMHISLALPLDLPDRLSGVRPSRDTERIICLIGIHVQLGQSYSWSQKPIVISSAVMHRELGMNCHPASPSPRSLRRHNEDEANQGTDRQVGQSVLVPAPPVEGDAQYQGA